MVTSKVVINIEKLKELRAKHKYSISDLAYTLGYKTPSGYWIIEKSQRKVSIDTLYRLAKLYKVHMEELLLEIE